MFTILILLFIFKIPINSNIATINSNTTNINTAFSGILLILFHFYYNFSSKYVTELYKNYYSGFAIGLSI